MLLFLDIETEHEWPVAALGPAAIATYLRERGREVRLLRVPVDRDAEAVAAEVSALGPVLVGMSLTTRQWLRAREVAAAVRRVCGVPVVAGGLHPTFAVEETLAGGFDAVCLGEGERALLALVEHLEAGGAIGAARVPNIWLRGADRPGLFPPLDPAEHPFLARDMTGEEYGVRYVVTQRGCPFHCSYCSARTYHDLYPGYGARRGVAHVVDEVRAMRGEGEVSYVIFTDDTFTVDRGWVEEFCSAWGLSMPPFSIHARCDTVSREMLERLARTGCRHVVFGVESGSERVRREIMRRKMSDARIEAAFGWAREAGLLVTANYMLGVPGETAEEMEMTLELNARLAPDDFGFFVYYPYPGTRLFELCREKGLLPEDWLERPAAGDRTILALPRAVQDAIHRCYARLAEAREENARRRSAG